MKTIGSGDDLEVVALDPYYKGRPQWEDDFFSAYERLVEAGEKPTIPRLCREMAELGYKLSLSTIYQKIRQDGPGFDPMFNNRWIDAESARIDPIRESLHDSLESGKSPTTSLKLLASHPATRGIYGEPPQELRISKTTRQIMERRLTLRAEFAEQSRKKFGGSNAKSLPLVRSDPADIGGDSANVGELAAVDAEAEVVSIEEVEQEEEVVRDG